MTLISRFLCSLTFVAFVAALLWAGLVFAAKSFGI